MVRSDSRNVAGRALGVLALVVALLPPAAAGADGADPGPPLRHVDELPPLVYPDVRPGPPPPRDLAPRVQSLPDPLGLVLHAAYQRDVNLGVDQVAVVVCQVPADTTDPVYVSSQPFVHRDAAQVAAWANQTAQPWFVQVSGGRYAVEFTAYDGPDGGEDPSVIELGPADRPEDCYQEALDRVGSPYSNVLAIDTTSLAVGFAGPGSLHWDPGSGVAVGATLSTSPRDYRRGLYIGGGVAGTGDELDLTGRPAVLVHEIGHTLHWPHSFHPGQPSEYTNPIDVMSGFDLTGNDLCPGEPGSEPCPALSTLAFNRYASGWIDPADVEVLTLGTRDVSLRALGHPGTQMAVVPVDGRLVTLEARIAEGVDAAIGRPGVAVHLIDQREGQCPEKAPGLLDSGCFSLHRRQHPAVGPPGSSDHVLGVGDHVEVSDTVEVQVVAAVDGGYDVVVTVKPSPPSAPRGVTVTAGQERVVARWQAPVDDGGSPITGYTATATPGNRSCSTSGALTCAIAGLTNGVSYRVSVRAANAAGTGPASVPSPPVIPRGVGYWMASADGRVYGFGSSTSDPSRPAPTVAIASGPAGSYWLLHADGRVTARGGAAHHGDARSVTVQPGERVSTIAAHPDGRGYWIFTNRGRVVPRGAVSSFGDLRAIALNGPIVGAAASPSGGGYYMVGSDGGVFTFGNAQFRGSTGAMPLNEPVVSLVPTPGGSGYWLVAADGGIFSFGAPFRGSVPGVLRAGGRLNRPVIGALAYGNGYVMVASDGGAFVFSDAPFLGSLGASPPPSPIVGLAVRRP